MDIFFLIVLLLFALWGWKRGVVKAIIGLMGSVVAVFLAARYFGVVADIIAAKAGWEGNITRFFSFALGFILLAVLTKFLFKVLEKLFRVLTNFPLWGMSDKVFGTVFGVFEGILIIAAFIYIVERFPIHNGLMLALAGSTLAPHFSAVPGYLGPLIPEALRIMDSVVDYVENVVRSV